MTSHLLRRRLAAAAVSALLVTGASACGGGGSGASPFSGGASSPTGSTTATTPAAPASNDGQASGSSVSKDDIAAIIKNGMSAIDTAHESMTMDMSASGQAISMDAEADIKMKPSLAMSMTMNMSGQSIKALLAGGAMYMKMPAMPGGKWVKIDLKQLDAMLGGGAMSDALTSPMGMLDKMSSYITSASYVGDESVDGASAKHYTMTVDLKSAMAAMAPSLAKAGSLPSTAQQDLWVDDQGRVVKTVSDFGSGKVTTVLSDFGKSVDVQAPPASDVMEMPNVGGSGGLSGLGG